MTRLMTQEEYEARYRNSLDTALINFKEGVKSATWKQGKNIADWKAAWKTGVTASGVDAKYQAGIENTNEDYWKYKALVGGTAKMRSSMEASASTWASTMFPFIQKVKQAGAAARVVNKAKTGKLRAVALMTANYDAMQTHKPTKKIRRAVPSGVTLADL